jgi:hypothetical protein
VADTTTPETTSDTAARRATSERRVRDMGNSFDVQLAVTS